MTLENGRLLIFNSSDEVVMKDKTDLKEWCERTISEDTLARRMSKRNGFEPAITGDQAVEVAHKLAYFRTKK